MIHCDHTTKPNNDNLGHSNAFMGIYLHMKLLIYLLLTETKVVEIGIKLPKPRNGEPKSIITLKKSPIWLELISINKEQT